MATVERQLPETHFKNVVRWIKRADAERVEQLGKVLSRTMKRLDIPPGTSEHVVPGVPAGGNHVDVLSLSEWSDRITRNDTEAISQIRSFTATIQDRLTR